jgi:hypothetical protein
MQIDQVIHKLEMMKTTYFESRRDEVSVLVTQQVNNEEPELKKDDMNIVK